MKIKYSDFVKTYSKIHRNSIYYPKVMKFHDKGLKVKNISKKLNLPYLLVWRWVNNKTIPHSYLEYSKIKKKFNSKEIKNLAKVMGYIYGDGGILKNGRIHYCNTEKFLISDFIKSVNKVFAQNPHIKKESKIFRVKFSAIMGKTLW